MACFLGNGPSSKVKGESQMEQLGMVRVAVGLSFWKHSLLSAKLAYHSAIIWPVVPNILGLGPRHRARPFYIHKTHA